MQKTESAETRIAAPEPPQRLWAPWRLEYIVGPKDGACFLCAEAAHTDIRKSQLLVARGQTCFVVMNRYPYNAGHLMIVPYRHTGDLGELTEAELTEIMQLTVRAKRVLDRLSRPEGYNFGFNIGAAGGAGLREHIHAHLVPRWFGDTNFMSVLGETRAVVQALEETTLQLRRAWDQV